MIRRLVLTLVLVLLPFSTFAQSGPFLDVTLPEDEEFLVGQPINLHMKLLVPTWMLEPPRWPELEVPSLLVRLPERASIPATETINGETWSGISRTYRLYPLASGVFEIPAQKLNLTYAEPVTVKPIKEELDVPEIRFSVVIPDGAKNLTPLIVASGFTLSQEIGGDNQLQVGGALVRTVTAEIQGTTPILIPALIAPLEQAGNGTPSLRTYPGEPVVRDSENRGVLSGSRTDTVSYVAQVGGTAVLPTISFEWFNLDSNTVETASLDGMTLTIPEPPPPPPGSADYALWIAIGLGAVLFGWLFARFLWPLTRLWALQIRVRWRSSEQYANRCVLKALQAGDLGNAMAALDDWTGFHPQIDSQDVDLMKAAFARIGLARYGNGSTEMETLACWKNARRAYHELHRQTERRQRHANKANDLPDLNPN